MADQLTAPETEVITETPRSKTVNDFDADFLKVVKEAIEPEEKEVVKKVDGEEPQEVIEKEKIEESGSPKKEEITDDGFEYTIPVKQADGKYKDVPIDEELENFEYSIQADGETFTAPNFTVLKQWASNGVHAAQEISRARAEADEKIQLAEEAIRTSENQTQNLVQQGIQDGLRVIIQRIANGLDGATGKPLAAEDREGAEQLANKISGHLENQRVKALEDQLKEIQENTQSRETKQIIEQRSQEARDLMETAVKPFYQAFLKSDGKTLNTALYSTFRHSVDLKAGEILREYRRQYGIPDDPKQKGFRILTRNEYEPFLKQALNEVFSEFKDILPKGSTSEETKKVSTDKRPPSPVSKTQSKLPATGIKRTRGRNSFDQDYDEIVKELG